jgi:hypothetical protein
MTAVRESPAGRRTGGWCGLLAGIALSGTLAACAPIEVRSKPGTTTTVIMTRHADRDPDSQELNAVGRSRAVALADAVRGMGVTAIYSPNVERNLDTVRPLARELGIKITITPETSVYIADAIAREMLDRHAGGVIVFVGNVTGNLQAVFHFLGAVGDGPISYGDLFVLTVSDTQPVSIERRRYGP